MRAVGRNNSQDGTDLALSEGEVFLERHGMFGSPALGAGAGHGLCRRKKSFDSREGPAGHEMHGERLGSDDQPTATQRQPRFATAQVRDSSRSQAPPVVRTLLRVLSSHSAQDLATRILTEGPLPLGAISCMVFNRYIAI